MTRSCKGQAGSVVYLNSVLLFFGAVGALVGFIGGAAYGRSELIFIGIIVLPATIMLALTCKFT